MSRPPSFPSSIPSLTSEFKSCAEPKLKVILVILKS